MSSTISRRPRETSRALVHERLGRLAASSAVAVAGAIALFNTCNKPTLSIAWWLVYTIGAGLVLSPKRGDSLKVIALLALLPAATPMIVYSLVLNLTEYEVCMSFAIRPDRVLAFAILLPLITWLAIFIFSFGRLPAKSAARFILGTSENPERIEKIASAIRSIIAAIAMIVLLISALGK
jgi:hypothetical protein